MITDIERVRVQKGQFFLFPTTARDVCRILELNWRSALQLHENGFLSFNPETAGNLDSAQVAELKFLGSLVIAGCNKSMLERLTRYLRKPYQYFLGLMYYDWALQKWLLLQDIDEVDEEEADEEEADEEEADEEDPFENWLEMM